MEPEIARRCKSCGAAVRPRSAFCPQCGVAVAEGNAPSAPAGSASTGATESSQPTPAESAQLAETMSPATGREAPPLKTQVPVQAEAAAPDGLRGKETALPGTPVENPLLANTIAPGAVNPPDAATAGKQQRVATAKAREFVDDNMRPRAEKLRRASNVVLDEAAADPSLRFVLVAAVLIILSLLLLLLGRLL